MLKCRRDPAFDIIADFRLVRWQPMLLLHMRLLSLVGWEKKVTEHTMLFYLEYMFRGNVFSRMSQCFERISTFTANSAKHFFCCSNSMHSKQLFSVVSFTRYLHTAFIADYWFFPFFRFLQRPVRVSPLQNVREYIILEYINIGFAIDLQPRNHYWL